MNLKKKSISIALSSLLLLSAVPGFASNMDSTKDIEIKSINDVRTIMEIEKMDATRLSTVPVVNTLVDFTGATVVEKEIEYNMFKYNIFGYDTDSDSMSNNAIRKVSIRKTNNNYTFRVYTKTMERWGTEADLTGMTLVDNNTGSIFVGEPGGSRPGANIDDEIQLVVPDYIDIEVPENIFGRGPIANYENRLQALCETNLDQTLPSWIPFPDAMINPKANLGFNIN